MSEILTAKALADRYQISSETLKVWRWRATRGEKGYPPFIKLGRSVRYRVADFERWINKKQEKGTE